MTRPKIPGVEVIDRGLIDLAAGRETVEALLVEIAAPRLRFLGYDVPQPGGTERSDAEIRLYQLLGRQDHRDPYREYNAVLGRLQRTCRALEAALFRSRRQAR